MIKVGPLKREKEEDAVGTDACTVGAERTNLGNVFEFHHVRHTAVTVEFQGVNTTINHFPDCFSQHS